MTQLAVQVLSHPDSDFVINLSPTERILRRTALVAIGEHRCPPSHPLFQSGGPQTCPYIGFMRSSVVRVADSGRSIVSEVHTPNIGGFHNVGSTYRRRAIDEMGDRSDWIALSPSLLRDLSGRGGDDSDDIIFHDPFAPISPSIFLAQRHLNEVLNSNPDVSDLAVEEYVIRLVRCILDGASDFWRLDSGHRRDVRPTCERQRRAIVSEVKQRVATRYWSAQSLNELARGVHCSPGQLARIFFEQTGFSVHGYQLQVRLRASLHMLRETPFELADVAVQLGFSNHSHFSTVFRRYFGVTPSQFAKSRSRGLDASFLELIQGVLKSAETT